MTDEEFEGIVTEVVNRITRNSVDVASVDVIDSSDDLASKHVNTLPGSTADGTIVQVAIDVLAKPAREAASSATSAASTANAAAQAAIGAKTTIESSFEEIKSQANGVINDCEVATTNAQTAADNIGNKKILVITEDQYAQLLQGETIEVEGKEYSMDINTIYFTTEEEPV